MLEIFQQIETAIQKAAAAEGITLPPNAFPPYPADIDKMLMTPMRPPPPPPRRS